MDRGPARDRLDLPREKIARVRALMEQPSLASLPFPMMATAMFSPQHQRLKPGRVFSGRSGRE
jgi:hypothetical protein